MLYREIMVVYCTDHMQHTNALFGDDAEYSVLKLAGYIETIKRMKG